MKVHITISTHGNSTRDPNPLDMKNILEDLLDSDEHFDRALGSPDQYSLNLTIEQDSVEE